MEIGIRKGLTEANIFVLIAEAWQLIHVYAFFAVNFRCPASVFSIAIVKETVAVERWACLVCSNKCNCSLCRRKVSCMCGPSQCFRKLFIL